MVAACFQNVGSTVLDLSTITTTATPKGYSARTTAPQLLVWDPTYGNGGGRYVTYYYITDAYDEVNDDDVTAWANSLGDAVSSVELPLGSALWFYCPSEVGKTVTVAGQVSDEDDLTAQAVIAGHTMIGNPFPMPTALNSVDWFGADGVTPLVAGTYSGRASAPQVLVWDPTYGNGGGRYVTYYYITDAYDEANDDDVTAWADSLGDVATDTIPAGQGFWLFLPSGYAGAKATFTK